MDDFPFDSNPLKLFLNFRALIAKNKIFCLMERELNHANLKISGSKEFSRIFSRNLHHAKKNNLT